MEKEKEKVSIKEIKDYGTEDFRKFDDRVSKLRRWEKDKIERNFDDLREKISDRVYLGIIEIEPPIDKTVKFQEIVNLYEKEYEKALTENPILAKSYEIILDAAKFLKDGIFLFKDSTPAYAIDGEIKNLQLEVVSTVCHKINEMWDLYDKKDYEKFEKRLEQYKKLQEEAEKKRDGVLALCYKTIIEAAEIYRSYYQKFPSEIRENNFISIRWWKSIGLNLKKRLKSF
jgi:hypothetical protein